MHSLPKTHKPDRFAKTAATVAVFFLALIVFGLVGCQTHNDGWNDISLQHAIWAEMNKGK